MTKMMQYIARESYDVIKLKLDIFQVLKSNCHLLFILFIYYYL